MYKSRRELTGSIPEIETKKLLWTSGKTFYLISLLFIAFFWVNADNWFGAKLDQAAIGVYAILPALFMFYLKVDPDMLNKLTDSKLPRKWHPDSLTMQIFYVLAGILATLALMLVLFNLGFGSFGITQKAASFGMLSYFLFAVAPAEEIIFRGTIPYALKKRTNNELIIILISQGTFGLFHGAIYSWNISTMLTAFAIGTIWYFVSQRFGLATSIGSHFVYNACVTGILVFTIAGTFPFALLVLAAIVIPLFWVMSRDNKKNKIGVMA